MKPVIFALLAICCAASLNVIVERKLAQASPIANSLVLVCSSMVFILPVALLQRRLDPDFTWPPLDNLWLLLGIGLSITVADYFYFKAYNSGGTVIVVTTVVMLLPAIASLINVGFGGKMPTWQQFLGWMFAAIAVLFLSQSPSTETPGETSSTQHEVSE